ncbi:hypothetical protein ACHIPZ_20665 [Antrihabitans sp. NCIMB 15449]|uniref:Type VII secretion integral membrane protein EccD n=1 Tax=Antrihabitans spumae TaxID=3373370 RepID=A0ABW7JRG7_9NOCA
MQTSRTAAATVSAGAVIETAASFAVAITAASMLVAPRALLDHEDRVVQVLTSELITDNPHVNSAGIALGAIAAVVAGAALRGSRAAWWVAAGALLVSGLAAGTTTTVITIVGAVAAGIALGAAAAAAWRRASGMPAIALVTGFAGSALLKDCYLQDDSRPWASYTPSATSPTDPSAPVWLFVVAVALAAITALMATSAAVTETRAPLRLSFVSVTATVTLLAAQVFVGDQILKGTIGSYAALAVLFVVVLGCAVLVGRIDGPWSGTFLIVMAAVTAAGYATAGEKYTSSATLLLVPLLCLGAGIAVGVIFRHRPLRVIIALALIPIALALPQLFALTGVAVLGGFALGVCLPGAGPLAAVVALTIPATAAAFASIADAEAQGSPRIALAGVVVACAVGTVAVGWFSRATKE